MQQSRKVNEIFLRDVEAGCRRGMRRWDADQGRGEGIQMRDADEGCEGRIQTMGVEAG